MKNLKNRVALSTIIDGQNNFLFENRPSLFRFFIFFLTKYGTYNDNKVKLYHNNYILSTERFSPIGTIVYVSKKF